MPFEPSRAPMPVDSARAIGAKRRDEFVEKVRKMGRHLEQVRGQLCRNAAGAVVGIAFARERARDRWFLGLPAGEFDNAVLLCEKQSGRVFAVCLPKAFFDRYGEAAGGRRVSGRLRLPPPSDGLTTRPWPVRATDFDLMRHMNNSAYWHAVEDELERLVPGSVPVNAELEHRAAIEPDNPVELGSSLEDEKASMWLTVRGETRAAAHVSLRAGARGTRH